DAHSRGLDDHRSGCGRSPAQRPVGRLSLLLRWRAHERDPQPHAHRETTDRGGRSRDPSGLRNTSAHAAGMATKTCVPSTMALARVLEVCPARRRCAAPETKMPNPAVIATASVSEMSCL